MGSPDQPRDDHGRWSGSGGGGGSGKGGKKSKGIAASTPKSVQKANTYKVLQEALHQAKGQAAELASIKAQGVNVSKGQKVIDAKIKAIQKEINKNQGIPSRPARKK